MELDGPCGAGVAKVFANAGYAVYDVRR